MSNKVNRTQSNKKSRRALKSRRGVSAVEFALVAPTFLMVIVICAEFGRLCVMRNLALNACYESSRMVMTEGGTVQDGIDRANQMLSRVGNVQATILVNGADGSLDGDGNVINEVEFDTPEVTTRISINLAQNSVLVPAAIFGNAQIQAQMTMRTERFAGFFNAQTATP